MMHLAWRSIEEVPYNFSRSSIKFQGHTEHKITDFDPNWAFPDCNSILIAPMDLKWCTKIDVLLKRCHIVLQGHPSNFKATQAEKSTTWIQFWVRLLPVGLSQLSNPCDLPWVFFQNQYTVCESWTGNENQRRCHTVLKIMIWPDHNRLTTASQPWVGVRNHMPTCLNYRF